MSSEIMTTGDVARRLDVSTEFIRKLARAGKLAAIRTAGGQRIYKVEDVERLAVERELQNRERNAPTTRE
jgi:excisionase family DNA binding protein